MRIKFEKGITPEVMANTLLGLIQEHGKMVGSVNVYVQFYDENMDIEKDTVAITCSATAKEKAIYSGYEADSRRRRLRVVNE
jgi:hypothetical protein